jgi:hypothetical protein
LERAEERRHNCKRDTSDNPNKAMPYA